MTSCLALLKLMKGRQFYMTWLVLVCSVYTFLFAQPPEEVRKFTYKGQSEDLHYTEIIVNAKMVAMSGYIYVGTADKVPVGIEVNGTIAPTPWDSTGFDFGMPFPLIGVTTPFTYDIDYKIWVDSITAGGDTIQIQKDTSARIEFDVVIQDGAPDLPDTFDVEYWERELGFYYNNNQVTVINEAMTPLELRFSYNNSNANYNYTEADIVVTTFEGLLQDKETFTLSYNGNSFTGTFPRVVISDNATSTPRNDILEHYAVDTLVAIFMNNENPQLPLDTLKIKAPFRLSGLIRILCGHYYDNNADGFVDSIFVEVSTDIAGGLTDTHVQEILDTALTLPAFRDFTINGSGVVSDGFYIDVSEGSTPPTTYVTSEDKLTVIQDILTMGGWIQDTIAPIYDKVAPIIHWEQKSAYLINHIVDSIADTLGIKFSEPIENVTHEQPFYFLDVSANPDTNYTVRLTAVGQPSPDRMVFYVTAQNVINAEDGDSIWIHETSRVSDVSGNYQNNSNNIRSKLYVRIILTPYELIHNTFSPLDISKIDSNDYVIPDSIIDILSNQGILADLDLSQNSNGDYVGMMISIAPDNIGLVVPDFTLIGDIDIDDANDNQVVPASKMGWDDENKSLVWVWNCKNQNGEYVFSGTYACYILIEERTPSLGFQNGGPQQVRGFYVEVTGNDKADDSCGGCGTSSELAFIPPIGFKLASMIDRRKKWWYKFFKRLKAMVTCS